MKKLLIVHSMKFTTIKIVSFFFAFLLLANDSEGQKFFIRFTDKNNSPYSVSNPADFLSARALARRAAQNIAVTTEDLPVNPNYVDSVIAKGATVITRNKWFNGVTVQCDSTILADILNLPFVVNATKVIRKKNVTDNPLPDKHLPYSAPSVLRTASLDYGQSFNQIHLMNGEYLHNLGYTGSGMVIAVLDAGFYNVDQLSAFDSLRLRGGILGTWDFVDNNSTVYDDDVHGMEVLSCMAGNTPGQLVGTAPAADYWLLRSEDNFSENIIEEYNWEAAAEFADSVGADVITSSLGYTEFEDTLASHTYADMNGHTCPSSIAANIAFSKGILVITSAGNSGANSWHYISAPADGDSVLAVGAVDEFGNYVGFSSVGPSSDGDIKPNVAAKGLGATIADQNNNIGAGNGTSFACPILAGSATCLMQAHPTSSAREVKVAIEKSANYFAIPTDTMGYGIPNFASADFLLGTVTIDPINYTFAVYPNPYIDEFNIRVYHSTNTIAVGAIYDLMGRTISEFESAITGGSYQTITINSLSGLNAGIYFLDLRVGEKVYTQKIIKRNQER